MRIVIAALAAAALTAGCAAGPNSGPYGAGDVGRRDLASAPAPPRCFFARSVSGFSPASGDAVNVRVGVRDVYRLDLAGPCPDLDFTLALALRTRGGGSSICDGFDAELLVPSPAGARTCPVSEVRALAPAEVAALAPRERP